MKVRDQLISILTLLVTSILFISFILKESITQNTNALLKDKLMETKTVDVPKIVQLQDAAIKNYAYDYCVWNQMVDFTEGRKDTSWVKEELSMALARHHVNYVWVLDSNCTRRYWSNLNNTPGTSNLPVPVAALKSLLQKQKYSPFFISYEGRIVQIFPGIVRPTNSITGKGNARGYLLMGRIVDDAYLHFMRDLRSDLTVDLVTPGKAFTDFASSGEGNLRFSVPIKAWDGGTLGAFNITRNYSVLNKYQTYLKWYNIAFICLVAGISLLCYFIIKKVFLQPLRLLSYALEHHTTEALATLTKKKNEFGDQARLISNFFIQNNLLRNEIETRKKSEAALISAMKARKLAESEKKMVEEFLKQQQALLKLNSDTQAGHEELLRETMTISSKSINCERVGIWLYDKERKSIIATEVYKNSKNTFEPEVSFTEEEYPAYFKELKKQLMIAADDARIDPSTIELAQEYLIPNNISSMLDVPIRCGDQIFGTICFEHVGPKREWSLNEKIFARSVADITAIRMAAQELIATEKELIKSQQRFEETQELAHIGSWEVNFFSKDTIWSEEMYRIFEIEKVAGRNPALAFRSKIHPSSISGFDNAVKKLIETKITTSVECQLISRGGQTKYVLAIGEALLSPNSAKVIGLRGTVQDITKQKEAAMAKSEFLSCMSHEIRTPINGVIGIANLLQEETLSEKQADYVRTLNFSAQHLSTLVSDILDFSKIESGHLTFERVSFNLEKNCQNVYNLFLQKAAEKNLTFNFKPALLHDFSLYGDYVRLNQVLSNLLSNAIKFTEKGSIDFSYTVEEESRHGVMLCFKVKDSGIGITEKQQAHIFESFSQADETITRQYGGTGLGLTISKKLVELQGGSISVQSIPREGSEFSVRLSFDKHVYEEEDIKHITTAEKSSVKNLQGMRILVAEDNHVNAMVLTSFLNKWSIESKVAKDGSEVLGLLQDENFDIVLMDIQMPNIDGIEATKLIRDSTDKRFNTIPVIAFTADASVDTHRELLKIGFNHCMTKPFNPETLFSFLKKSYKAA